MHKTIAITGSTGFVGSHLVRSLFKDSHRVKAFGRLAKAPDSLIKCAKYYVWDITKRANYTNQGNADTFIHAASFVDFWGKKQLIYDANVVGTKNAIKLAQQMGAKTFIYISSASVYDPLADNIDVKESAPYARRYLNYYAQTKVAAEKLLQGTNFDSVVILRPHAVYGPGDRTVVPQIINKIKHQHFILPGQGNTKHSITHVANIVDAVRGVINNPPKGYCVLNIADKKPIKIKDFINEVLGKYNKNISIIYIPYPVGLMAAYGLELLAHLTSANKSPLLTVNLLKQLCHESTLNISKANKLIGYTARYSLTGGLNDTFDWIESVGGLDGTKKDPSQISWTGKIKVY